MKDYIYIICLACILPINLLAQQLTIAGQVTGDAGETLPFVNILLNDDPHRGTTTDIDGRFQLAVDAAPLRLTFKYVGYETLSVEYTSEQLATPLQIRLQAAQLSLGEVVVTAGENPAHRIIRAAVAQRDRNHPEKLASYRCRRYNKLNFSFLPKEDKFKEYYARKDTSKRSTGKTYRRVSRVMEWSKRRHLFVMEAISQRYFQRPDRQTEKVTHNRVSGFRNPTFVAIANEIQPFSFYDEQLTFVGQDFLNPISPGSTSQYFFDLRDTLYRGADTVFVITYHPRKQKTFNGLKGLLYINTSRYAIQNVTAEPADTSVLHLKIEQKYQQVPSGHWFPEQLNFEIALPSYPAPYIGLGIKGKSYIDEVAINPELNKDIFTGNELVTRLPDANAVSDSLLATFRPEPLKNKEVNTYVFLDSLGAEKKFDRRLQQLEALAAGRFPLGAIDLDLNRLLAFNNFEGTRLGVGLLTNRRFSQKLQLSGYTGYGIRDESWKYGGQIRWYWNEAKDFRTDLFYQKDLWEPGAPAFPFIQSIVSRRFFAGRMDRRETIGAEISGFPLDYLQAGAAVRRNRYRPIYDYAYQSGETTVSAFDFTVADLKMQYAFGRKYVRVLGQKLPTDTPYPTLSLSYALGMDNTDRNFTFQQWLFSVDHSLSLFTLDQLKYRLEAGYTNRDVPYPFLFGTSGIGRDFQLFVLDNTFQTMAEYEFLSDRFVSLFLRYDFGRPLYRTHLSRPRLSLVHNGGWGDLRQPERHREIVFDRLNRTYLEAGLVVRDVVRINYVNFLYIGLGGAAFYRYGPYHLPETKDNFAFRLNLDFTF